MRVGVTGSNGLLGRTLVTLWRRAGADVLGWTRGDFDVRDGVATRRAIVAARPDVVVHAGAYTAVDRAEAEPELAMAVNRDGTAAVCAAGREVGARVVYVSTDYVFDGSAREPVPPSARPAPLGAYARSKAEGERAAQASGVASLIVRTGWVYGPAGRNFVDEMRAAAAARRGVTVVDDQVGAPTSARLVSEGLWALVRAGAGGVWHLAAAGAASWFDVARLVFGESGAPVDLVARCSAAAAGRAAPRPAYSVLDCRETARRIGVGLPAWEDHVRAYVRTWEQRGLGIIGEVTG
ncbi:MAG: dTDP-4-dehydrorhamnose reductase [Gemmatimonadetes bacterium]|nr:dTDP-4-dehydrorhamnose reductase [Gemmatimonadota bacterium]